MAGKEYSKIPEFEANDAVKNSTSSHPVKEKRRWSLRVYLAKVLAACCIIYLAILALGLMTPHYIRTNPGVSIFFNPQEQARKPLLEAHIMSKCPDARDCLRDLVVPVMVEMSDDIDFKLSYIGKEMDSEQIQCMHGPEECLGNILELCAADYYPDPKIYLGFTMCLTDDYSHIPDRNLIEDCSLEHAVAFDDLNHCASRDDGSYGMDLLRHSVRRSAAANVTSSCTVRLNDDIRCIRDGGEWKDCNGGHKPKDLIHDIKALLSR